MVSVAEIAQQYERAVARLKRGEVEAAFTEFRAIIAVTAPVEEHETETEVVRPYQAEPSEFATAAAASQTGKPVRLVLDYFTAALYHAGCALVAMDEPAEAKLYLEEVYGLWPKNVTVKLQFSYVLARLEQRGNAIAVLQEAEALAPKDPRVARQWIWTFNELGDHHEARVVGERLLVEHGDYRPLLEELHAAYDALGEAALAQAMAARIAAIDAPGQA